MLREFDLHNQRLTLPNGTTIPYRYLKIPCCNDCNTVWLNRIENVVSVAVRAGPDAVEALDSVTLALWMTKIFYGLMFKDLSLAADRLHPTGNTILDDQTLKHFAELHHVLQVARQRVELTLGQAPATVLVFRTLDTRESLLRFDYRDLLAPPFLAIRMGPVGLVACLLDWGAVGDLEIEKLGTARQLELHPTQFCEVAALCAHWLTRLNRVPKYLSVGGEGSPDQLITLPLGGMSNKPIFDEFDFETYAHLLALFTGNDLGRVWRRETEQVWSSLTTPDGTPLQVPSVEGVAIQPPIPQ